MKLLKDICYYTGSEQFYKHPFFPGCSFTEGVKYVADKASAYWLIDAIFSYIGYFSEYDEWFYTVRLQRIKDNEFVLEIGDNESPKQWRQKIEFSDFPEDYIRFLLCDNEGSLGWTLMLPSEY